MEVDLAMPYCQILPFVGCNIWPVSIYLSLFPSHIFVCKKLMSDISDIVFFFFFIGDRPLKIAFSTLHE